MTKELEKEVEDKGVEYADKQKRTISIHEDSGYSWGQVEQAYEKGALDFAEPREKRIAELELKIKHLTEHLEPQAMTSLFKQVEEEVKQEQMIEELKRFLALWKNAICEIRAKNKACEDNAHIEHLCDKLESSMVGYSKGDIEYAHFAI